MSTHDGGTQESHDRRIDRPTVRAEQEAGHLVLHEEQSPFGWLASDVSVEVRQ